MRTSSRTTLRPHDHPASVLITTALLDLLTGEAHLRFAMGPSRRGIRAKQEVDVRTRQGGMSIVPNALKGRVALVTGASGGIGQAIALRLAAEGVAVALGYSSSAKAAEHLAET